MIYHLSTNVILKTVHAMAALQSMACGPEQRALLAPVLCRERTALLAEMIKNAFVEVVLRLGPLVADMDMGEEATAMNIGERADIAAMNKSERGDNAAENKSEGADNAAENMSERADNAAMSMGEEAMAISVGEWADDVADCQLTVELITPAWLGSSRHTVVRRALEQTVAHTAMSLWCRASLSEGASGRIAASLADSFAAIASGWHDSVISSLSPSPRPTIRYRGH